ncbi:MAG TPA: MBL fold metallo-hydrolase [Thermoanaerobaculia bacterium]|jgi:L-ascorbate metabolism protein UlaG (beta-lactamase superfamily)|nr:MBL fold metallo-hydrolase [Thermoanaerobaculia bacterium]
MTDRTLAIASTDAPPDFARGSIEFIGTATVILRYAGFTILTDPNFLHKGDHVHLGYGMRSQRLTEPARSFEELPPIDFVLLSHYHGDHFDQLVEKRLEKSMPIVTTKHAAAALKALGFERALALETWEAVTVTKGAASMRITAMPGKHAPGMLRPMIPPVMGSMLELRGPTGNIALRLYITGDTLIHEHLREIPKRFPEIDLALLHLGGTRIAGVLLTMDAKQGVEMIRITNPRTSIPIHYDDYGVFKSPLSEFQAAVREAGLEGRVHYLARGETFDLELPAARL